MEEYVALNLILVVMSNRAARLKRCCGMPRGGKMEEEEGTGGRQGGSHGHDRDVGRPQGMKGQGSDQE